MVVETIRRNFLAGAAGLPLAAGVAVAEEAPDDGAFSYDYVFLDFSEEARAPHAAFAAHLHGAGGRAIEAANGELVGFFEPGIGWSSRQGAVIIRWRGDTRQRARGIAALRQFGVVHTATRTPLAATARPAFTDCPRPGGIHILRWFEVQETAVEEFVAVSVRGWPNYETRFDMGVFGLFRAKSSSQDRRRGLARLLLVTRYANYTVWEATRGGGHDVAGDFARRAQLTRMAHPVSAILSTR